ncbi:MAG: hypothetical protein EOP06_04170, partial [Proteobacteria bacterium]
MAHKKRSHKKETRSATIRPKKGVSEARYDLLGELDSVRTCDYGDITLKQQLEIDLFADILKMMSRHVIYKL